MKEFKEYEICSGANIVFVPADKFKTGAIQIEFVLPLKKETAGVNSLLINLLSRTTKKYPDITSFNRKLAMLYGATVYAGSDKHGENQALSLMISSLADRFSIDGESITNEAFRFLLSMIFEANTDENGDFYALDIEREKRLLIEKIESEENDKRRYALLKLRENMFKDEPYSVNPLGDKNEIKNIKNEELKSAYISLIKNAKIQITIIGDADYDAVTRTATRFFENVERAYTKPRKSVIIRNVEKVNTVCESMSVKQGKLVLGFRIDDDSQTKRNNALTVFSDVFGGGPYSKLFMNVREKMSLCYYCSTKYDRRKSALYIQCGCEEENMDKAIGEILNQLDAIKRGEFDSEFESSVMAICNTVDSISDSLYSLLSWYSIQITDEEIVSPSKVIESVKALEKEEIRKCAELLSLDTVYKLVSSGEVE